MNNFRDDLAGSKDGVSSLKWWDAAVPIVVYLTIQIALSILAILYSLVKAPENLFSQLINQPSFSIDNFTKSIQSITNGTLGQAIFISSVMSLIFVFIYLKLRRIDFKVIGLSRRFNPRELLLAVLLTIGLLIVGFVYGFLIEFFVRALGLNVSYQSQQIVKMFGRSTSSLILIALSVVVLAPILEELMFRGILFNYLDSKMKFSYAALISSFIFAAVHGLILLMPELMLIGFVLAYIVKRSKSILPAMLIHALNNGAMFVLLYLGVI